MVDIAELHDFFDANLAECDEDRAAHIHGSLPDLLDELEKLRSETVRQRSDLVDLLKYRDELMQERDALIADAANHVARDNAREAVLERLRRFRDAVMKHVGRDRLSDLALRTDPDVANVMAGERAALVKEQGNA